MASEDFRPQSHNAMFATILLRLDTIDTRLKEGSEHMGAQDIVLDEIKTQALKTNGRVTKLEGMWKVVTAKIAGALLVLSALVGTLTWLYEQGFRITH